MGFSNCSQIEYGYYYVGGTVYTKDVYVLWNSFYYTDYSDTTRWIPKCGDGRAVGNELWDDANTIAGDGCAADWLTIKEDYKCFGKTYNAIINFFPTEFLLPLWKNLIILMYEISEMLGILQILQIILNELKLLYQEIQNQLQLLL